jgi:hypothetical protein
VNNPFSVAAMPSKERRKSLMVQVYQAFVQLGPEGATREAVYVPMGIRTQTGHPICSDLIREGKLIRTGRRGVSRLGRAAEILVADVHVGKL